MPSSSVERTAQDLRDAMNGDTDALNRLWARTHPKLRMTIRALPAAGREGSILQATAVAHSIYRLQAERAQRASGPFKESDIEYAFAAEGVDPERFRGGAAEIDDLCAERVFSRLVRSEARTYLADKRRRQRHGAPLMPEHDTAGQDQRHILMSAFIDFEESLQRARVDPTLVEVAELDMIYQMEPAEIVRQLGLPADRVDDLVRRARVLLQAWRKGVPLG
jgi:hypothetical protein